MKEAIVT